MTSNPHFHKMRHQTTIDEDYENQASSSLPLYQRASQSQLITRIYYPETLYPDSYSFFADRSDTSTTLQINDPLPMDPSDQYPVSELSNPPPTISSTLHKQPTTEIEIVDRHSKYPVSNIDLSLYYSHPFLSDLFLFCFWLHIYFKKKKP